MVEGTTQLLFVEIAPLREITSSWGAGDWTPHLREVTWTALDPESEKFVRKQLRAEVHRGHKGRARNWALLYIAQRDVRAVDIPQFQDCLRPTNVPASRLGLLGALLRDLAALAPHVSSDALTPARLSSWGTYAELFRATRADEHKLLKDLRRHRGHSLHSIAILTEQRFRGSDLSIATGFMRSFPSLSREEMANGLSYALEEYTRAYGLSGAEFRPFAATAPLPEEFKQQALIATRLREIVDLEASVFRLEYVCLRLRSGAFRIHPPTARMGMAMSLGYLRHAWNPLRFQPGTEGNRVEFRQICEDWYTRYAADFVGVESADDRARIRIKLPAPVLEEMSPLFKADGLYAEEIADVMSTCYELSTDVRSLFACKLTDALSVGDVHSIGRVFRLLEFVRARAIALQKNALVRLNSTIAAITPEHLAQTIEKVGFSPQAAKDYVRLFSWTPSEGKFLDLQYTPLIQLGALTAQLPAVHARSNLVRSGLVLARVRLDSEGSEDPVGKDLEEVMRTLTSQVARGVDYRVDDMADELAGDIDCLVGLNDVCYAFEVKNTLVPCSAFEQRTAFDHLNKAANQLSRLRAAWSDELRSRLEARLGWHPPRELRTCIVLSTRIFSGIHFRGHPVRDLPELANLINDGTVLARMVGGGSGGIVGCISLWRDAVFEQADLDRYLAPDGNPLYDSVWAASHEATVEWRFSASSLQIPGFGFDPEEFQRMLALSGRVLPVEEIASRSETQGAV